MHQAKCFDEKLDNLPIYTFVGMTAIAQESDHFGRKVDNVSIKDILEGCFANHYISGNEKQGFSDYYCDYYNAAVAIFRKMERFRIEPLEKTKAFLYDYESIPRYVKLHNDAFIKKQLDDHHDFFDHCLTYPLDPQQRRSIISEEENCLVVSSAGSGKTSSIVGKVKYLIERKGVSPKKILLISYTNKAAAELTERVGVEGLRGFTFHKFALDLIGKVTGQKPTICDSTDALFVKIYQDLLANKSFRKAVVGYFIDYLLQESDSEKKKREQLELLSEQKAARYKALLPDMDGRIIYVRSEQEQKICFALSSLGVHFRYEEPYEHKVSDENHSQYRPDFSIYFMKDGKSRRIYLEHYGVDEHGLVPSWFAKDRGITYEEANKQYGDGITWKRDVHGKYGTTLITTSSADFHYFDIREQLRNKLIEQGVPVEIKTYEELYDMVLPPASKREKAFIRLIVTFVTLLKSCCRNLPDVLRDVEDERSSFVINNIFCPVYKQYISTLKEMGQIDFTDAILWATQLCKESHPVSFDYIIVDEFQDISIDRYNFLKALREGNPPAKLYCVGDDWQSIYRFSGSDMALFNQFPEFFGPTDINKIETTYRFGEPLVSLSSRFIQRNSAQVAKNIHPFHSDIKTELFFYAYDQYNYCSVFEQIISSIPVEKSVFLLGRYSFDDYFLSNTYQSVKEGKKFFYIIYGRRMEFLTVHKSKGLEADYVVLLQCNKDTYGFPSQISDDPSLNYVLTKSDQFPFGEERRLFYVAITRAKEKTVVLYDQRRPSVFVDEFLHPEKVTADSYMKHPNANKRWTRSADKFLLTLYKEGKSIKYIAEKLGRSQTSIIMRLGKLGIS